MKVKLWVCIGAASLLGLLTIQSVDAAENQASIKEHTSKNRSDITPVILSPVDVIFDIRKADSDEENASNFPTEPFYTTVGEWIEAQRSTALKVIGVRLSPTETGVEVFLDTATGQLAPPTTTTNSNTLIADIPNAVLALPDGQEFRAENPVAGITAVTVTQVNPTQVRVSVTGTEGAPLAQVVPSAQGLTLSLSPAEVDTGIEVLVTAQKRPEDPQNVPISLTVLSQEELEDAQVNSLRDVAANTPNFFTTTGDRAFNFYSIRGLGNSNVLVRDTASFYIDDVPYDNIHQFFPGELFDLERVEVLRGPQSTLYGRNSQAGAINIISRPPTEELEFQTSALYGNYNQHQVQLSLSDSLIPDTLGFRFAGIYSARDGFTENTFLDNDANDQSGLAGRFNLLWTPSEAWSGSLNVTGSSDRDEAPVYVPIDQDDPFEVARDENGSVDLSTGTQSLRIAYEGSAMRFTSITAHSSTDYEYIADGDDTIENLGLFVTQLNQNIWSQEFRLQSPEDAERFRWLVGAYYQSRDFDIEEDTEYTLEGATEFGLLIAGTDSVVSEYYQTTYAGFAQVDFQPIEPLTLTAGLRYEYWQDQLDREAVFAAVDGTETPFGLSNLAPLDDSDVDADAWLPRFAVSYRVNPNLLVYGTIARGYRPGTQNYRADDQATLEIDPEESWNYEIGLKTSWLDDRLTVNLAAFYNDLTNYQVILPGPDTLYRDITNGQARVLGAELEIKATPLDGFDIIAGFGYADAEFTDYTNPYTNEEFDGNRLLFAPEYTYNLALQYRTPGGFFGRVELQGLGTIFFDEANEVEQDPFALVNVRLGYEFETVGVYLFANNLFDTEYVTVAFPSADQILAGYGDRRTFGVQFQTRF